MDNIKNNLANIRDGFSILDGQDKLVYLIDLGKKLDHINESDRTENRKIHDSEFSEELFDAVLHNLTNHKQMFRVH